MREAAIESTPQIELTTLRTIHVRSAGRICVSTASVVGCAGQIATSVCKLAKGHSIRCRDATAASHEVFGEDSTLLGWTGSHTVLGHWGHRKSGPDEPAPKSGPQNKV
ncbi:hypothetical protein MKK70_22325 [Methylobacterium sp. E-041]|jgi:hypothetical protein|uniref:hypothetical protein n=1 Tax=unclassified Methylobacterium TaxID=2615210 RepID=UPI001FBA8059|nr:MULTISPECIES: hypothetical protein [unclassified Methylobacterium]MCJ2009433.1 hypothetical protein [Methylobacterium sp. J-092]MCJ2074411.1 hypothetical protein [Methylobacterium sp. E-016]MCJ2108059.1 hypothetical protein [Methylobacterium sp. E-041]